MSGNKDTNNNPSDEDKAPGDYFLIASVLTCVAFLLYMQYKRDKWARTTVPKWQKGNGAEVDLEITFCATTRKITIRDVTHKQQNVTHKQQESIPVGELLLTADLEKEPYWSGLPCFKLPKNYKAALIDQIEKRARTAFNIDSKHSIYYSNKFKYKHFGSRGVDELKLPAFVDKIISTAKFIYPEMPPKSKKSTLEESTLEESTLEESTLNDHIILPINLDAEGISPALLDPTLTCSPIAIKNIPLRDDGHLDHEQVILLLNQQMKEYTDNNGISSNKIRIVFWQESCLVTLEEFFLSIESAAKSAAQNVAKYKTLQNASPLRMGELSQKLEDKQHSRPRI